MVINGGLQFGFKDGGQVIVPGSFRVHWFWLHFSDASSHSRYMIELTGFRVQVQTTIFKFLRCGWEYSNKIDNRFDRQLKPGLINNRFWEVGSGHCTCKSSPTLHLEVSFIEGNFEIDWWLNRQLNLFGICFCWITDLETGKNWFLGSINRIKLFPTRDETSNQCLESSHSFNKTQDYWYSVNSQRFYSKRFDMLYKSSSVE